MPHFDTGPVHMAYLGILNDLTSLACQFRHLGQLNHFSFSSVICQHSFSKMQSKRKLQRIICIDKDKPRIIN